MRLIYILVDFENVKPTAADFKLIRGADYRVLLFHGPHQNKFDADIVKALQPLGAQVDYEKGERAGKNALDFRMAFFLGGLAKEFESDKAKPSVVVLSKDTDLDTLLEHVRSLGFDARRATTVKDAMSSGKVPTSAPARVSKTSNKGPISDSLQTLVTYLVEHPKNRPAKIETLKNHLSNIFGGAMSDPEKAAVIAELVAKGYGVVTGKKIEYRIPEGG